jgi:hypothetical protein
LAEFVQFDDAKHKEQFLDLNIEYMTWIRNEVTERYDRDMFQGRPSVRQYVESVLPKFVEAKPPEGIVYVLEINGVVSGMWVCNNLILTTR